MSAFIVEHVTRLITYRLKEFLLQFNSAVEAGGYRDHLVVSLDKWSVGDYTGVLKLSCADAFIV